MAEQAPSSELEHIRRERDLYRRLLGLGGQGELARFLEEALALVAQVTGARQGYLELQAEDEAGGEAWSIAHGF